MKNSFHQWRGIISPRSKWFKIIRKSRRNVSSVLYAQRYNYMVGMLKLSHILLLLPVELNIFKCRSPNSYMIFKKFIIFRLTISSISWWSFSVLVVVIDHDSLDDVVTINCCLYMHNNVHTIHYRVTRRVRVN